MPTYKKLLKNREGDTIIPAFGGNITADDINLSTLVEKVGTDSNYCLKYADGTMIACVKKTSSISFAEWGSITESETVNPPNYAVSFVATPVCTYSVQDPGLQVWFGTGSGRTSTSYAASASKGPGVVCYRTTTGNTSVTIEWIAIGRWKA